jgi:hypothetical protein
MRVTRILDLVVILLLATVVLMPRADVTVKPALPVDSQLRDRVAELQSMLVGHPGAVDPTLEVANIYLDGHRPDWALATVDGALKTHPDDFRLHHLRAIAYADRFEGEPAFEAATKALALCEDAPSCGDATRSRLSLLTTTLEAVAKVDMRNKPYLAKERIFQTLHPAFIPRARKDAKKEMKKETRQKPGEKPTAPLPAPDRSP